jgi:hypothetical protein
MIQAGCANGLFVGETRLTDVFELKWTQLFTFGSGTGKGSRARILVRDQHEVPSCSAISMMPLRRKP